MSSTASRANEYGSAANQHLSDSEQDARSLRSVDIESEYVVENKLSKREEEELEDLEEKILSRPT
jgi:hypothetical protein